MAGFPLSFRALSRRQIDHGLPDDNLDDQVIGVAVTNTSSQGELADTGAETGPPVVIALVMIAIGFVLLGIELWTTRLRRQQAAF